MTGFKCRFVFLMIFISPGGFGQHNQIQNLFNGLFFCNGEYTTYYSDSTVMSAFSVLNNKLDSTYKDYYPNGSLRIKCNFKDGFLNGDSYKFDKQNRLTVYWQFYSDTLIAEKRFYYYKNDTLKIIYYWSLDKMGSDHLSPETIQQLLDYTNIRGNAVSLSNGYVKTFYKNGNIKYEGLRINNKKYGIWKYYSGNGNIKREKVFSYNREQ